jgi:sigma-B regulation protein RsbU (phosphoserine phosphatase)
MAVLVRTQGTHQGKWVYPVGRRCVLGRHTECDVSDVFQDRSGVSRFHAQIEVDGGRFFLEDRGSRNGTFLNGQRLSTRTALRSGDRITIDGIELTFTEEAAAGTASASSAALDRVSFAEPPGSSQIPISSFTVPPAAPVALAGYHGEKLRALAKMLQRLGRSLDVNETLGELLTGLFAIFSQAQRGFVAFTGEGGEVTPRATHFHRNEVNANVRISRTLIKHVLSRREAVLWADSDSLADLATGTLCEMNIRSLMCAPLLDGEGNPFGVVQIDTDQPMLGFDSEDLEVMVGAVSQAAVAVRFAKLHEEALRRETVQRDLELARRVQLGLLPLSYPKYEEFEYFAYYHAAHEVGGDYYDFIELPGDRLALVVADAAGKGVSAALMMAKLSGELKYYLSCEPPAAALARLNDRLCDNDTGRFVTLLAAVQDRRSSALTLVNAGHPAPLRRRRDGTVEAIGESARGTALGLIPGRPYQEFQTAIESGEVWFMYTDGFTEAINAREEMFGATRFAERLARAPGAVGAVGERIVADVRTFLGDRPQSDDMCLVGWGRLSDQTHTAGPTEKVPLNQGQATQQITSIPRRDDHRPEDRGK